MNRTALLTGVLLLAGAGGAVAQVSRPATAADDGRIATPSRQLGPISSPVNLPTASLNGAAVEYRIVDSLANSFSFYSFGAEPLAYEPMTNTLVMIKRGNPTQTGNLIYIRTSNDLGLTWGPALGPLHDATTGGPARYPSVTPLNLTGTTNPQELFYYFTAPTLLVAGAFGTYISGLVDASGTALVPPLVSNALPTGQTWSTDAHTMVSLDRSTLVTLGSVSGNSLAVRRFDVQGGTITDFIPPAWDSANFVAAETADSRTSTFAGADVDASGTMMAGIFSRYPSVETVSGRAMPGPSISTSIDNGATWTALDIMPRSVVDAYLTSKGATLDSSGFGYSTNDFIVTGNNSASFILNLSESDETRGDAQLREVVEVYYYSGSWGIRNVGTQNGWFLLDNGGGDTSSQVDNEIQVARTADGNRLLAKWTVALNYISQNDITGDGMAPDTFGTSDVHMSSRAISETEWSSQVNVTETAILDRQTWIPKIIPNDLTNVPMITIQSKLDPAVDVLPIDSLFHAQRITTTRVQYVMATNVDASAAIGGVTGPIFTATSRLNPPLPNPVGDRSVVTFSLRKAGHVTIDVYNAAGQKISTILDDRRDIGNHAVALESAGMQPGNYFYTMRVNGEALTQGFQVVR